MIRYTEKVVDERVCVSLLLADHEIAHVQACDREVNQGVLLLLHALKTLQVNDKDRWSPEDLEFFHCLFMHLASGAKPSVLV
jgi:hypothetical protein